MTHTTNLDRIRAAAKANGWTEEDSAWDPCFVKGDTLLRVHVGPSGSILSAMTTDLADPDALASWAVRAHDHGKLDLIREILRTRN